MNARMHIYNNKECFVNQKNYLIIGASGGIGKAMVKQLIEMSANNKSSGKIFATYHTNQPDFAADNLYWLPMDVSDEKSIEQAIADIKQQTTHIDWVINCVGLLHTPHNQPEKALRQLETDFFLQNMQINALASCSLPSISSHYWLKPSAMRISRRFLRPYRLGLVVLATISLAVGTATV